jgi:hypothetical protein
MKNKINIAELLKDCPSGLELDCTMYEDVHLDYVDELNNIRCYIQQKFNKTSVVFNQDGTPNSHTKSKCVIFPKGETTWEGFQKPFEDGDIVAYGGDLFTDHLQIFIFKDKKENNTLSDCYLMLDVDRDELYLDDGMYYVTRFATEEEKQKLFDAIKDNGYKWNPETKTLEILIKPKFKVGDRIIKRDSIVNSWIVSSVNSEYYGLKLPNGYECIGVISIAEQDEYELVPTKFDITTLKPFKSEVLVRNYKSDYWKPAIFGFTEKDKNDPSYVVVGGNFYYKCIPYEGNEHLLGTTDDCDDYYKL